MSKPRQTTEAPPALEPWQQELLEQAGELYIPGLGRVTAPQRRSPAGPAPAEPAEETAPTERGES